MNKPDRPSGSSAIRTTAILIAVISMLYLAREILVPLAFAITLALILTPAVDWLQKLHLARVPAVALVMLVTIAAAGAIGWVIFNQLVAVANELPGYRQNIHNKLEAMRAPGEGALGRATASIQDLARDLTSVKAPVAPPAPGDRGSRPLAVQIVDQPANELEYVRDLVKPFLAPLGEFGIILIFSVFLLINQEDLRNRLFRLVGLDQLNVMTLALDDATHRVSRYLLMQLLVNTCFGFLCGAGLYLIGIPYAALWGSVAGIFRMVPYAGAVISALLPFTLSLAVFDSWTHPLLVLLLFATLELITSNFVEPWFYGIHTGISALAMLLTAVFWTVLWGPAGLILSTPLTVCVVVLGRYVPQFSFLHILLGDDAVLAAEARFYQRLLAMDDHEARAVAGLYLKENSLQQLYDSVIVPALAMAEQDRHKGGLDPTREEFLFLSVREMLVEFSEKTVKSDAKAAEDAGVELAKERNPKTLPGRVFCLPASDEADEITAAMLAQLLEQAGHAAISFALDPSLMHTIELMDPADNDIFCISALPPFAFARARTLSRRLQLGFPRTKIMIGVWGFTGDAEHALERFQPSRPAKLVSSLADAVRFARDPDPIIADPIIVPAEESLSARDPTPVNPA
ncbi:MAG TPA: AI-2E family transporter [Bryobacteraceae bacterium]|jgi:predicted PurR-regulated permease PerM|nr:AI-2E family transporter [Bryobacteraceae bacterium]